MPSDFSLGRPSPMSKIVPDDSTGEINHLHTDAAISTLVEAVPDPSSGLPDEIFYYISRTTPLVNVDLLIKDEKDRTLLSWRNDRYAGKGWHIPGGIVRFKENLETRVEKVARSEIGATVRFDPTPSPFTRLSFRSVKFADISFHYYTRCFLSGTFKPLNEGLSPEDAGYLAWHDRCPVDLLPIQEIYRKYID
jgi:ADP-ribose pyrophosphatase YjhB (NUDIX family)